MTKHEDRLIRAIEQLDEKSLKEFFNFFLTPSEKAAIADRLQLVQLLLEGKLTQREIAAQYHISIAKITRGSNMLKGLSDKKKEWLRSLVN